MGQPEPKVVGQFDRRTQAKQHLTFGQRGTRSALSSGKHRAGVWTVGPHSIQALAKIECPTPRTSMYLPDSFRLDDRAALFAHAEAYPFATVITHGEGGVAVSHLPLLVDAGRDLLRVHARRGRSGREPPSSPRRRRPRPPAGAPRAREPAARAPGRQDGSAGDLPWSSRLHFALRVHRAAERADLELRSRARARTVATRRRVRTARDPRRYGEALRRHWLAPPGTRGVRACQAGRDHRLRDRARAPRGQVEDQPEPFAHGPGARGFMARARRRIEPGARRPHARSARGSKVANVTYAEKGGPWQSKYDLSASKPSTTSIPCSSTSRRGRCPRKTGAGCSSPIRGRTAPIADTPSTRRGRRSGFSAPSSAPDRWRAAWSGSAASPPGPS